MYCRPVAGNFFAHMLLAAPADPWRSAKPDDIGNHANQSQPNTAIKNPSAAPAPSGAKSLWTAKPHNPELHRSDIKSRAKQIAWMRDAAPYGACLPYYAVAIKMPLLTELSGVPMFFGTLAVASAQPWGRNPLPNAVCSP